MALEKKEVVISGYKNANGELEDRLYLFTKFTTTKGMEVQFKLFDEEFKMTPDFIKDVICSSVSVGSTGLMKPAQFDEYFSGRFQHLQEVYAAVLEFNFDENFTESASEEK